MRAECESFPVRKAATDTNLISPQVWYPILGGLNIKSGLPLLDGQPDVVIFDRNQGIRFLLTSLIAILIETELRRGL